MRPDDQIRKCVVFVGVEADDRFIPTGTGFLIGIPHRGLDFHFLVTASHVLDDMSSDTFSIRINRRSGPADTKKLDRREAIRHENPNNDISLIPFCVDFTVADAMVQRMERSEIERQRNEIWDIGVGDEVCAIGLYTSHYGELKNIPVVRIGNLAMIADEPVFGPNNTLVEAYLIELRTLAGLSGSPVLIIPPHVKTHNNKRTTLRVSDTAVFLGVLIGYHMVESAEDVIPVPELQHEQNVGEKDSTKLPTGFGVVIPIERVIEIAERDDVRAAMDHWIESNPSPFRKASLAQRKDSPSQNDANPRHKEDFNRLLDEAAKPRRSDDET